MERLPYTENDWHKIRERREEAQEFSAEWLSDTPNNRPQDGRVCDCEDAPCCGHYDL